MKLSIIVTAAMAGALAPALLCASGASATAAPPVMSATYLQPSGTTIPWTSQQYQREITLERGVGITEIVDQWTIDEDANQAYYPDAAYFIISPQPHEERPVRAFSIRDDDVSELEISSG